MSGNYSNDNYIYYTDNTNLTLLNKTHRGRKSKSETAAENNLKIIRKQKIDEICKFLFEPMIIRKRTREECLTFASVKALIARNNEKTGLNDLAECVVNNEWADFTCSSTSPAITLYVSMCNYLQKTPGNQILEKHRLQNPGEQRGIRWKLNEKNSIVQKALDEMKTWKYPQVIIKQKNNQIQISEYAATANQFKPKPTKETVAGVFPEQFRYNNDDDFADNASMNNNRLSNSGAACGHKAVPTLCIRLTLEAATANGNNSFDDPEAETYQTYVLTYFERPGS
ncbi:8158_t:CDS:2 [Ambispora gerdemannii]|uniref:8158_t:CDS:1 n=1 Tax=Ambispora gerdemannii TaxID=144530 RepID=A0A9N9AYS6_9GLOM|nr:8158_t:CDS:2 [Ambispora gerdemannii]